jgi:hypothetical protein
MKSSFSADKTKSIALTPKDVRAKLLKKWENGFFFSSSPDMYPYRVFLGSISSAQILAHFEEVQKWIEKYVIDSSKNNNTLEKSIYTIEWKDIHTRLLGKNRIPNALLFDCAENVARFVGKFTEYQTFLTLREKLTQVDTRLSAWANTKPFDVLKYGQEIDKLIRLWQWMIKNPSPSMYLRQIDLPEIDTKFTEAHKKVLSDWLDITLPEETINQKFSGVKFFEQRYGYKTKPELIRMRFLDPALYWNGCSDISIDSESFCNLELEKLSAKPENIFVIENDITALAFPPVSQGLVIFGRGYNFSQWNNAEWLKTQNIWYWGDLDTHGFRILDQFRCIFPQTKSFLMDTTTLLANKSSWVYEDEPCHNDLSHLTVEENAVYDALRYNHLQENLRLEQEFITFSAIKMFFEDEKEM